MKYIKVEFSGGITGEGYQEVNDVGEVVRYIRESGEEINMLDENGNTIVYESKVIDVNTTFQLPS